MLLPSPVEWPSKACSAFLFLEALPLLLELEFLGKVPPAPVINKISFTTDKNCTYE